ncbi:porin [Occallatibacter riparius]|uniref:Porin n=1 Tax=Occallatibacter riparius TaxID=1002689 RepID=A0A9J7BZA5_9BACT|nr:porin [Occallatibacter riparius]UWZ86966.1 porin [Occallatibacter riparius]
MSRKSFPISHAFLLLMFPILAAPIVAQDQQSSQPAPSSEPSVPVPLPTPSITGPLQGAPPHTVDSGPLGKISINGVLTGFGVGQSCPVAGDSDGHAALNNGQVWAQKVDGWWQFYVQAGAYNVLAVGAPFLATEKNITDLWSPVPVAYLKLVPAKNTSIQIGSLPALLGAEYTFDFQNMNVERGLLWTQANAINRGVQVNQAMGKFAASLSWNDGYYSNRYSWLSGSLSYTNGPHSIAFQGMGNLSQTAYRTTATPVQNNGRMYALTYTYTKGNWIVMPAWQYGDVPTNAAAGVARGAATQGGALFVSRTFKHGFSLAGRGEYLGSTGSAAENSVNLIYGPGSAAWSLTGTPAWQKKVFFMRGDVSYVRASSIAADSAFGAEGTKADQTRGVLEVGFLF